MTKNLIVAIADNYAIGRKNQLLWHISEDLQYFKKTTTGCPVIMGYMTYLSIGRPLPKRKNIVISIFPWPDAPEGVTVVGSLAEAYAAAGDGDVFVMGGGETYRNALPTADKLYITHVHTTIEDADTWFPLIDPAIWEVEKTSEVKTDPESGYHAYTTNDGTSGAAFCINHGLHYTSRTLPIAGKYTASPQAAASTS